MGQAVNKCCCYPDMGVNISKLWISPLPLLQSAKIMHDAKQPPGKDSGLTTGPVAHPGTQTFGPMVADPFAAPRTRFTVRPFTSRTFASGGTPVQRQAQPGGIAIADFSIFPESGPVVQRWFDPQSALRVQTILENATSPASARRMLRALDTPEFSEDGFYVNVALFPAPRPPVQLASMDAVELRTIALERLINLLMASLQQERQPLVDQMNAATTAADRRTAMEALRDTDRPKLDELRQLTSHRSNRWEHSDPTVQDAILAAIQLEATFNAEADMDEPNADVHRASYRTAGMAASHDWCGFFASREYIRSSLDSDLKKGFFHVNNVVDYFTYRYNRSRRIRKWIYASDDWHTVEDFHNQRGSLRQWLNTETIQTAASLDIRPGDIVLMDHQSDGNPDHIVMVHTWNPTDNRLITIGGNDGGYQVDQNPDHPAPRGESEARQEEREELEEASGRPLRRGSRGGHVGIRAVPQVKIFGIGRPSIVDFEDHTYSATNSRQAPTEPPVP